MKRRILSLTLALALCLTLLPLSAAAEEPSGVQTATIAAGHYHSFAIKTDGSLWAWGSNENGRLGDGTTQHRLSPVKIMDDVGMVSAGSSHSMAVKTDGSLWAWGGNWAGQLGDGTLDERHSPVKIMDGVSSIAAGYAHSMAIKTDGSLWAWGDNFGQLGDGTLDERHSPVKIMDDVRWIAAAMRHSMAVKTDGSLWAWGNNDDGRLGDGTAEFRRLTPVKIMDGVDSTAAGFHHSMAIKTDGSFWTWGDNWAGQLGDGTLDERNSPVKITEGADSSAAGLYHTMVVKTDGSLWGWGSNYYGQIGDGVFGNRLIPAKIMDDVSSISAGAYYSLAIKTDGSLWAWGSNGMGQLGTGTIETYPTPVKIMDGVMLPTGSGAAQENPQNPNAIADAPSPWALEQVSAAIEAKLVPASLQARYTQPITRAEFCALAVALYENVTGSVITGRTKFDDTDDVNVQKAAFIEVVNGMGNNTFSPGAELTREQAAAMLSRLAAAIGKPLDESSPIFDDDSEISPWAMGAVGQVQAAEIMGGIGHNTFYPKGAYTIEQSILTMLRVYNIANGTAPKPGIDPVYKAWALGCCAILALANDDTEPLQFGMMTKIPVNEARAKDVLSDFWGCYSREDIIETIEFMTDHGHNEDFAAAYEIITLLTDEEYSELMEVYSDTDKHMFEQTKSLGEKWGYKQIKAWDWFRMVHLATWGYVAGYMELDEVYECMDPIIERLSMTFSSWEEASENYMDGYAWWSGVEINNAEGTEYARRLELYQSIKGDEAIFDPSVWE